ncbi:MAG: tRNA (adenosine(37)-N6)-dimethylallyltransferase MiaA, partial [Bacteroidales bacterium]
MATSTASKKLIVIEGPTGVGKTAYSIELAQKLQTEILSADSRQFYKELNIGVARPSLEELSKVPHHFIAHLSIESYYSVSKYEQEALLLLEHLFTLHDQVVMVGGSGLYVDAICQGIDDLPDPENALREDLKARLATEGIESLRKQLQILDPNYYAQVDLANPKRLLRALEVCLTTGKTYSSLRTQTPKTRPFQIERLALTRPRAELYQRIDQRVEQMLSAGLLQEVASLQAYKELNALNTVGYKELFPYFENQISLDQAIL